MAWKNIKLAIETTKSIKLTFLMQIIDTLDLFLVLMYHNYSTMFSQIVKGEKLPGASKENENKLFATINSACRYTCKARVYICTRFECSKNRNDTFQDN